MSTPLRQEAAPGATLFCTVSGRWLDLCNPKAEDIWFPDIAEQLAKEARYNGATPGSVYSVAEHLVRGADFIARTSRPAAAYFLCHDFHEAYLKDDTTPKKRALDHVAQSFGSLAGAVSGAYRALVDRFDGVIHEAAGLRWPMSLDTLHLVETVDRKMLVTEWQKLRPTHPLPKIYESVEPLPICIEPWPWEIARAELLIRMDQLLPVFAQRASPDAAGEGDVFGEAPAKPEVAFG